MVFPHRIRAARFFPTAVSAGVLVPLLFVLFAMWGALMSFPAFQAIAVGIPLTDSVSTIENGERALRPVWAIALPGISLAAIGLLGALWSYHQYRMPEDGGDG